MKTERRRKKATSSLLKRNGYFYVSRSMLYSIFLVLPLLVIYEILVLRINESQNMIIRNGADVIFKMFLDQFGIRGVFAYTILIISVVLIILIIQAHSQGGVQLKLRYLGLMTIESAIYAAFLGFVISYLTQAVLFSNPTPDSVDTHIMVSLGAGFYEELVFRVLLLGGTATTLQKLLGFQKPAAYVTAALFSSFMFSIFHYLGNESFALESFVFRFIAGIIFCILYALRGFGITAYTHAFYDLFLLL